MAEKRKADDEEEKSPQNKTARYEAQAQDPKTDERDGDGRTPRESEPAAAAAAAGAAKPAQPEAPDPALTLETPAAGDEGASSSTAGPHITEDEMCEPQPPSLFSNVAPAPDLIDDAFDAQRAGHPPARAGPLSEKLARGGRAARRAARSGR